jgi:hypothetical protein
MQSAFKLGWHFLYFFKKNGYADVQKTVFCKELNVSVTMIFNDPDRNDAAIVAIVFGILGLLGLLAGVISYAMAASKVTDPTTKKAGETFGSHIMMSAVVTALPALVCLALIFINPFGRIRNTDGARPLYIVSMVFGILGLVQLGHGVVSSISAKSGGNNLSGALENLMAKEQFLASIVPLLIFVGCVIPLLVKVMQ